MKNRDLSLGQESLIKFHLVHAEDGGRRRGSRGTAQTTRFGSKSSPPQIPLSDMVLSEGGTTPVWGRSCPHQNKRGVNAAVLVGVT